MNAKQAKKLRRQARERTVGQPHRNILSLTPLISNPRTESRIAMMRRPKEDNKSGGWGLTNYIPHQAVNDPESTRGLYRHLKRMS